MKNDTMLTEEFENKKRSINEMWIPDPEKFFIPIKEDWQASSYFHIFPVRQNQAWEYQSDENLPLIAIEEDFVMDFIYPFFSGRKDVSCNDFDRWGLNVYTFEIIESVLLELEHTAEKIEQNFDGHELPPACKRLCFCWDLHDDILYEYYRNFSKEEEYRFSRIHSYVTVNFYKDFSAKVRNMISAGREKGYHFIAFEGP